MARGWAQVAPAFPPAMAWLYSCPWTHVVMVYVQRPEIFPKKEAKLDMAHMIHVFSTGSEPPELCSLKFPQRSVQKINSCRNQRVQLARVVPGSRFDLSRLTV